ncbi:MAG: GNAT family N-acetyltransferase [Clostridium sp.]|nr:GNAT family N-acetyltransferase [Clostridium sp.]
MRIVRYHTGMREEWNRLVDESKNGTFLWNRNFMEYHAHRFADCSLMAYAENGALLAALPAHLDGDIVCSHGGLSYGGLILSRGITMRQTMDAWCGMMGRYAAELHPARMICKPIPYIYSTYPAEEMLYALFRSGAVLKARALSSALPLDAPLPLRTLRRRGMKKAVRDGWHVVENHTEDSQRLQRFWQILDTVLAGRHATHPVHSPQELQLLRSRFPGQISLFTVERDNAMAGGCVVFITPAVVHIQYIAASEEGRACGALDLLFAHLIGERFGGRRAFLDFGISTEQGGHLLNEGLTFQKEGFGGRAVCYDTYEIDFTNPHLASLLNEYDRRD